MTGGVDEETDGELLARLLELIRRPPAGGNRADYRRWALETPGVSAAYVYPLRRGLGTVDVVVTAAGDLPSGATLAAVQAHIDELRPVTAKNCLVLAPTPRVLDVSVAVRLSGLTLAQAQAQISTALSEYFARLAPGDTAVRSRMEALVSDITGVADRNLEQPGVGIKPVAGSQPEEGAGQHDEEHAQGHHDAEGPEQRAHRRHGVHGGLVNLLFGSLARVIHIAHQQQGVAQPLQIYGVIWLQRRSRLRRVLWFG